MDIQAEGRAGGHDVHSRSRLICSAENLLLLRISRNKLRDMRKPPALAALFPTVRGDVLAATLTQPDKWWYLSELAQFLQTTPSSLQRELKALVDGGILQTRREGTRAYFKTDT